MNTGAVIVVILAAGKGTRMHSDLPKVLHPLAGKPIIQYVINTAKKLTTKSIYLLYGYAGNLLKNALSDPDLTWVLQANQLGTGHAMQQAAVHFTGNEDILVLYGDVPLISTDTLERLLAAKPQGGISLLTVSLDNPAGYGRIVRENGAVVGIVEDKDATDTQQKINEINTGILVASGQDLKRWLSMLNNNNTQSEFYLTDIVALACAEKRKIETVHPGRLSEVQGVNNHLQLASLERIYQTSQAEKLLLSGVRLLDPATFSLRGELIYGRDVTIDAGVILEGRITLGNGVRIGAGCILKNCVIGDNCEIRPYSVLEDACLDARCTIGPFSHLRPGSELAEGVHVGNFVEVKKTRLGRGSKAGHLSYLGDATIGSGVNIGAGTITCNYDGANKFKTNIGDNVFIGSDTQLIAPVTIASGVTIGAGTTVTDDIAENELVLSRIRQIHIQGWQRPVKKK